MPRRPRRSLRVRAVQVPQEVPSTDALFIVLRRMRTPFVVLIVIFNVFVIGLTLIPGVDADGHPARLSVFESFYFVSYTATTIGFGEIPYSFTPEQRMWVTTMIYASVVGWAYAFGSLFALVQEDAFKSALAAQRFGRKVRAIREPFQIIAGYGHAGRLIGASLDQTGHRFVVVDGHPGQVDMVHSDALHSDVPALVADARKPGVLGLAGLGHPHCEGIMATTDDDEVNLSIVMAARLLRPDVPVVARCDSRTTLERMRDFSPTAIINPYDRYGENLVMALKRPVTYRLVSWLTSPAGSEIPRYRPGLADGRWMVCGETYFGREVAADLRRHGLDVTVTDFTREDDFRAIVGMVAATDQDSTNLAIAAHVRRINPKAFLSVRQESHQTGALVAAFDFDSVLIPSDVVAQEVLARVVTPMYWRVVRYISTRSDEWSAPLLDRIRQTFGERIPPSLLVRVDAESAPAPARRLDQGNRLTVGQLLADPDDRDLPLAAVPLAVFSTAGRTFLPGPDHPLSLGDRIVMLADDSAYDDLSITLHHDATVQYLATGERVASTWVWRALQQARRRSPR